MGQKGGFNQNCPFWGGKARRGRREPPRRGCPGPGPRQSVLLVKGPASLKSTNWKAWETRQRSETRDKAREHNEWGAWSAPPPSPCCSKTDAAGWNRRRRRPRGLKIRVLDKASAQTPLRHHTRSLTQIISGSSHLRAELTLSKTLHPFLVGNCNVLEPNRGAPERLRIIFAATQTARNIQVHVHAGHLTRSLRDFGLVWAFLNVSGLYFYVTVQATDMAGYGTKIKTTR